MAAGGKRRWQSCSLPPPFPIPQALKRALRPQNSGRNDFERAWKKMKQIRWDAATRKEQTAAALKERDEKRVARWRQKAAWAAEAAAKARA